MLHGYMCPPLDDALCIYILYKCVPRKRTGYVVGICFVHPKPPTAHRSCSCSPGLEAGADSSRKTKPQGHVPALLQSERGAPPNSLCSPGGICDAGLRRRQTTDQAIIMTISKDREKIYRDSGQEGTQFLYPHLCLSRGPPDGSL